ncbi:MAG: hypothetical protein U5K30_16980 [Acidimicrobiales bacterium]|nr:hypothetical protein [Acidimicrobiales bacterium]
MHPGPRPAFLSRRRFLLGAAASGVLVACSSDDGEVSGTTDGSGESTLDSSDLSVVRFFGPYYAAGEPARVPFGLSDTDGLLPADAVPGNVTLSVRNPEGETAAEGLTAVLHDEGLPRPYYSFEFTPASAGFYDLAVDVDGTEVISQFQVVAPDEPTVVDRVGPGDQLPAIETPTTDDARGVTPICTRDPQCDLHGQTVADALDAGGPVALLVATPAFCQTVVCGPILDILLEQVPDYPDVRFVHAEVYTDPSENEVPPTPEDFAPVIAELGLPYEPVLYVTGPDGVVRERLDYIFDARDMRASLDRALV